jgi:hypothetical protein
MIVFVRWHEDSGWEFREENKVEYTKLFSKESEFTIPIKEVVKELKKDYSWISEYTIDFIREY